MHEEYVSLVPQYGELGEDTDMEMLNVDGATRYANLVIDRDRVNGVWYVYQYPEFEEEDPSNLRHIGDLPVAYEGPVWPILRTYSEDEANAALLAMLDKSEKAWGCF